jgi:hypothetical protein
MELSWEIGKIVCRSSEDTDQSNSLVEGASTSWSFSCRNSTRRVNLTPSSHEGGEGEVPPRAQSPDQVWPKLTTLERGRLKFWIAHLPEVIAGHCSTLATRRGFAGSVGLVEGNEYFNFAIEWLHPASGPATFAGAVAPVTILDRDSAGISVSDAEVSPKTSCRLRVNKVDML